MKPALDSPPKTAMEVFRILPEGTRAEVIENTLYMSPSPLFNHQNICKAVFRRLMEVIEDTSRGQVFIAPFDVYLDEKENAVQPDLFVILDENKSILGSDGYVHGSPDLVIEVLSKNTREHDLVRKRGLYEQFLVKEYWVIDPESKLATGFSLTSNKYTLIAEDIGVIKSPILGQAVVF